MKKSALFSVLGLALCSAPTLVASANQTLNDKITFRIGPFFPSIDTSVTIGNEKQTFEDYLDDSATTAAIKGVWRISELKFLEFVRFVRPVGSSSDPDVSEPPRCTILTDDLRPTDKPVRLACIVPCIPE